MSGNGSTGFTALGVDRTGHKDQAEGDPWCTQKGSRSFFTIIESVCLALAAGGWCQRGRETEAPVRIGEKGTTQTVPRLWPGLVTTVLHLHWLLLLTTYTITDLVSSCLVWCCRCCCCCCCCCCCLNVRASDAMSLAPQRRLLAVCSLHATSC